MRSVIFGAVLLAVASVGFHHVISRPSCQPEMLKQRRFLNGSLRRSKRLRANRRRASSPLEELVAGPSSTENA